jgi:hypothetical protein
MSALLAVSLLVLAQAEQPEEVETADGDILFQAPLSEPDRIVSLEQKVARLEAQLATVPPPALQAPSPVTVFGYADLGFFVPQGNGAGYLQDHGNQAFPELAGRYGWVFYGDILAPAINSRGEVADLGDAPGVSRYDAVHSRGAPGFILNVASFGTRVAFSDELLFTASVNFTPRTGSEFSLGDTFDLDLAQVEWMPTADKRLSIFAGKMDSVLGVEYRQRRAPDRFGVTPSLLARYTTGTPLGLKARGKFFKGDLVTVALSFTNGSSTTEQFHFFDEVDSNAGKTFSGRLSLKPFALLDSTALGELELGVSGEWGPQDRARDSLDPMWFVGVDLLWQKGALGLEGQWLRGMSKGRALDSVYGLRLNQGAYLTATWRITSLIGVLLRGEFRDAFVFLADERAYITRSWRATVGVRLTFNEHVALKAEYLFNGEYGGVPFVPNDVFTSSLVLAY